MSSCNSSAQTQLLDAISSKDICISGVLIEADKSVLLKNFGKPDSIISRINEFEGTEFRQFVYLNSTFSISGNRFANFNLRDRAFQFDYGEIRVGDPEEKIRNIFPQSYSKREIRGSKVTIRVKVTDIDSYILFTSENGVVIRIHSWDDM